jgi:RNA polymerase sigma-70 factor (ECF subfamily)
MTNSVVQIAAREGPDAEIAELVAQAQQNPADFAPLYDRYIQPVYRYLYSRVNNFQDAEDLTAQTFLSALEALPRYRHKGHFSAWLFAIARRKAMDFFRKRRRETNLIETEDGVEDTDLLSNAKQSQDVQQLLSLVDGLEQTDQELIRLRFVADLSFAEMSALLGKKEDAVKKALYRLLVRLESQMEARND